MPRLLGRDAELALLTGYLDETDSGRGGVVVFSGEPGAGKSVLLDELAVLAQARRFTVVRTRCAPPWLPQGDPPSIRIIRALSAPACEPPERRCDGGDWSICELGPVMAQAADQQCTSTSTGDLCAFYCGLRQAFERASRDRALLLTVDDLHDADERLLGLLRFASHEFRDLRVLLVGAYCPLSASGPIRSTLEAVARVCRLIELRALDRGATARLAAEIGGRELDDSEVHRVHELTGGNPALVVEAALHNSAQARWTSTWVFHPELSGAVRAIVEKKLLPLTEEARALLRVASVLGESFARQLLLELLPLPAGAALAALSQAQAAGLLHRVGADRYRFAIGLVRRVLYHELSAAERAAVHLQVAAALEARKDRNFELTAGDIALHLLASHEPHAIGRALELARLSAAHSARAGDYHGAVVMYSIALEAVVLSAGADAELRCDLLIELAKAQEKANDPGGAHETLHQALAIAERLGDWTRLAEIALAAPMSNWPPPGTPNGLAIMLAETLLATPAQPESISHALVMARMAAELAPLPGERERSRRLAADALAISHRVQADEGSRLKLLRLRDCILGGPESIEERLSNSAALIANARRQGDWAALFEGEWAREVSLFQLGFLDSSDAGQQSLEYLAAMAGSQYGCRALAFKGVLALFEGRFDEGEELLKASREMAAKSGMADQGAQLWTALVIPLEEQERLGELEQLAATSLRKHRNSTFLRAMWSLLALKLGQTSEARFHLNRLAASDFHDLRNSAALLAEAAALTEICIELGEPPHCAQALYEMLLPYANRNAVCGIVAAFGAVPRYLGKLALSMSQLDRALEHFRAALEFNRRMGARPWAALTSRELALALLARGHEADRRSALELLANAQAEAVAMGMKRLAKSAAADLERLQAGHKEPRIRKSEVHHNGRAVANAATLYPLLCAGAADCANPPPGELIVSAGSREGQRPAFRLEDGHWTISYAGQVIRLKRLKGLNLIAYLLSRPNQEVHSLELARLAGLEPGSECPESSDLGPILDSTAKQSYRSRIRELREELEEARSFNDFARAGKLEEELCVVTRELARAVGLGGRDRRPGSQAERSRLRVTSAIRWATSKIAKQHPTLGRLLSETIRTGTSCSYVPGSNDGLDWDIRM